MRLTKLLMMTMLALGADMASPALAQDVTKARAPVILVTFNPPLDKIQRFRVTRSKATGTKMELSLSWIEELRFVRNGDGYVLYWRIPWDTLPPEMRQPLIAPMMRPFTGEPIAFELDSEGGVLGVQDWPSVKPKLLEAVSNSRGVLGKGQKDQEAVDSVIARVRTMFENMSAEDAGTVILKNIGPVLGLGGLEMRVGETRTDMVEVPVPPFGASVTQNVTLTMTAAEPGRSATIRVVKKMDRASMQKLMEAIFAQFPANDPARRKQMERELAATDQLTVVDTTTTVIDLTAGLPMSLETRRVGNADGVEKVDTVLIEWLR